MRAPHDPGPDHQADGHPPRVSVVVPVHDPGPALERSIESSLDQSLARDAYEVIFVDDGSTDGSGDRLDGLAASHPNVRVIHIDASGSPGRPRNVGVDAARGAYIQFLDADDRLGRRALEHQLEVAERVAADIVVGKLASDFRSVNLSLFRRTVEDGTLETVPVIGNLTVSKMFRTGLLREHGIRFPEGWPRIEDEHFVIRSYLAARTISVVADEPCYFYCGREDGGNLSSRPLDAEQFGEHLGQILALVDGSLPAGPLRTEIKRRFFSIEMLGKLGHEEFLAMPATGRTRLVAAMRALDREWIEEDVRATLPPLLRVRAALLAEGRVDSLVELARRHADLRLVATATDLLAVPDGLRVAYQVELRWADGAPFVLQGREGAWALDPRVTAGQPVPADAIAVRAEDLAAQAAVHEQGGFLDWMLKASSRLQLEPVGHGGEAVRPVLSGNITLDPGAPGPSRAPLTAGRWAIHVRTRGLGLDTRAPALAGPGVHLRGMASIIHDPAGLVTPAIAPDGTLELVSEPGPEAVLRRFAEEAPRRARGKPLVVWLPVHAGPTTRARLALAVVPDGATEPVLLASHAEPDEGDFSRTLVSATVSPPAGGWGSGGTVHLAAGPGSTVPLDARLVSATGHVRTEGLRAESVLAAVRRRTAIARRRARRAAGRAKRWVTRS